MNFDTAQIIANLRDTARLQHGDRPGSIMNLAADRISQQETWLNEARAEVERLAVARDEWRKTAYEITEQANKTRDNLTEERDIAKTDFEKVVGYNTKLQNELEKARAEVERLKRQEVKITFLGEASSSGGSGGPCAGNDHHVPADTKMIRPEPSRLEIAATLMAGLGNSIFDDARLALRAADALIAAAKGGAK